MVCYTNATTKRLEGFARARGLTLGITKSPDNSAGIFFIVNEDGRPLSRWISLGWSRDEAEEKIEHLAARASVSPSATGYSFNVGN